MARSAGRLWALHDLLHPVRSLANGLHLGLDGSVQMIDTSIVRVHQHAWRLRGRGETRLTGPVERWVTTKIHACVDTNGLRGVDRAEAATS